MISYNTNPIFINVFSTYIPKSKRVLQYQSMAKGLYKSNLAELKSDLKINQAEFKAGLVI